MHGNLLWSDRCNNNQISQHFKIHLYNREARDLITHYRNNYWYIESLYRSTHTRAHTAQGIKG